MKQPRAVIVLKSIHHLNTAKVARVIADVLEADILSPEGARADNVMEYDLIGFGSGIYFGRFHSDLRKWIDGLTPLKTRRQAFLFSTAGLSGLQRVWHAPLEKKLSTIGFEVLGDFCCRGHDTVGPLWLLGGLNRGHPDERDLARAAAFAEKVRKRSMN